MPSLSFTHEFVLPAGAVIDLDGHRVKLLESVPAQICFDVPIRMEVEKDADCCARQRTAADVATARVHIESIRAQAAECPP